MKKLLATTALLAAAVVAAGPSFASAESIELTYTDTATGGTVISTDLILTVTELTAGKYWITNLTGTRNGTAVTGFVATPGTTNPGDAFLDPSGNSQIDNLIFIPGSPGTFSYTDSSGFEFTTTDGTFNPFYSTGSFGTAGNYYEYPVGGNTPGPQITVAASLLTNPASVPEPSTIVMSSMGALMGLGVAIRRRKAIAA